MEDIIQKIKWLVNSDITTYEIEQQTGVTRATISNMRKKKDSYDYARMSLQNAISLANYYDSLRESSQFFQDQGGFISFTSSLDRWLTKAANLEDEPDEMRLIINKLKDLTLKDMDLLQELYQTFKENIKEVKE
jgi:transcriptional regulator with XRE-family HTH domain